MLSQKLFPKLISIRSLSFQYFPSVFYRLRSLLSSAHRYTAHKQQTLLSTNRQASFSNTMMDIFLTQTRKGLQLLTYTVFYYHQLFFALFRSVSYIFALHLAYFYCQSQDFATASFLEERRYRYTFSHCFSKSCTSLCILRVNGRARIQTFSTHQEIVQNFIYLGFRILLIVIGREGSIWGYESVSNIGLHIYNDFVPLFQILIVIQISNLIKFINPMNHSNSQQYQQYSHLPTSDYQSSTYQTRIIGSPTANESNPNLRVIYDSPNRNKSESRFSGSSRVVYDPKDSESREPRIIVNDTTKSISSLSPAKFINVQESQKKASRVIIHPPVSSIPQIFPNSPHAPTYTYQISHNPYAAESNHATFTQINKQSEVRYREASRVNTSIPISNNSNNSRLVSHISTQSVPRIQYDRCVIECKNWETKYNQLYLKYLNLSSKIQDPYPNSQRQMEELRQENRGLKKQLSQQKSMTKGMMESMEANFNEMLDRQKEATFKELELLVDRFRLQCRNNGE